MIGAAVTVTLHGLIVFAAGMFVAWLLHRFHDYSWRRSMGGADPAATAIRIRALNGMNDAELERIALSVRSEIRERPALAERWEIDITDDGATS